MVQKKFLIIGSLMAMSSVAIGAFAAHGLKPQLTNYQIDIFKTGVDYQFYHALGILIIAILADKIPVRAINIIGWCFTLGIILFSGSLYLLACQEILTANLKFLGPITPLGGTFFIIGWSLLFWNALKLPKP